MSDLDVEVTPDTDPIDRPYYIDQVDLAEVRRYVCLDMARMMAVLPEKAVKVAREMERFLLGKALRDVND